MRSLRRRALAMGACAAMMLAALVTATSSASASSSWQLVDEYNSSHPVCYTTSGGTNDLAIDLNGSWSAPINIGASGLPAGVSVASVWPSGEFIVQHHAVGQRWHHRADRNRSRRDPSLLQASLLSGRRRVNSGTRGSPASW